MPATDSMRSAAASASQRDRGRCIVTIWVASRDLLAELARSFRRDAPGKAELPEALLKMKAHSDVLFTRKFSLRGTGARTGTDGHGRTRPTRPTRPTRQTHPIHPSKIKVRSDPTREEARKAQPTQGTNGGERSSSGATLTERRPRLTACSRVRQYDGDSPVLCIIRIVLYYVLIQAVLSLQPFTFTALSAMTCTRSRGHVTSSQSHRLCMWVCVLCR